MDGILLGRCKNGHVSVRGDTLDGDALKEWYALAFNERRKKIVAALRVMCRGNLAPTRKQWDEQRPTSLPGAAAAAFYIGGDNSWSTAMETLGLDYECRTKLPHPGPDGITIAYYEDEVLPCGVDVMWYCDIRTKKEKTVIR